MLQYLKVLQKSKVSSSTTRRTSSFLCNSSRSSCSYGTAVGFRIKGFTSSTSFVSLSTNFVRSCTTTKDKDSKRPARLPLTFRKTTEIKKATKTKLSKNKEEDEGTLIFYFIFSSSSF